MLHPSKIARTLFAAALAAVLAGVVPTQAASAALAERAAPARGLDWLAGLTERLLAAVQGAAQAGPEIDPNGAPSAEPASGEGEGDAGPEIDPNG